MNEYRRLSIAVNRVGDPAFGEMEMERMQIIIIISEMDVLERITSGWF